MSDADLAEQRLCSGCKRWLPTSSFYPNGKGKGGLSRRCRDCHLDEWRLRRYGLTNDEYQQLLHSQDSVCAICLKEETITKRERVHRLAVDHDHDTGLVRGLLCARCNTGLGKFKDDMTLLTLAIMYLKTHDKLSRRTTGGCVFGSEGSLVVHRE